MGLISKFIVMGTLCEKLVAVAFGDEVDDVAAAVDKFNGRPAAAGGEPSDEDDLPVGLHSPPWGGAA